MNPFQRLRQAIDKVNLTYQFQEEIMEPDRDLPISQPAQQTIQQFPNNTDDLNRIKQLYGSAQSSHIAEISALAMKVEQLTKSLKRSEATI